MVDSKADTRKETLNLMKKYLLRQSPCKVSVDEAMDHLWCLNQFVNSKQPLALPLFLAPATARGEV
jgi:hypothetical protein